MAVTTKEALFKATKEPLRLLVLAIIPFLLSYFVAMPYSWAAVLVILLRWLDSVLHEMGKAKENDLLVTGLVRF